MEQINGKMYVPFQGEMITMLEGGKFTTLEGNRFDGRVVRGALRNKQQLNKPVVNQLKSAFNRYFGGDANGNQYTF